MQVPPQRIAPEPHPQLPPAHVVPDEHEVQSAPPWPQALVDVPLWHAPPEQQPEHDVESHAQAPDKQWSPEGQVPVVHRPPQPSSAPHALPVQLGVQPHIVSHWHDPATHCWPAGQVPVAQMPLQPLLWPHALELQSGVHEPVPHTLATPPAPHVEPGAQLPQSRSPPQANSWPHLPAHGVVEQLPASAPAPPSAAGPPPSDDAASEPYVGPSPVLPGHDPPGRRPCRGSRAPAPVPRWASQSRSTPHRRRRSSPSTCSATSSATTLACRSRVDEPSRSSPPATRCSASGARNGARYGLYVPVIPPA